MEKFLSTKDVAKLTGKSKRTVWGWCNSGKLKASRPGGREYVIKESDFLEFMNSDNNRRKHLEAEVNG